MTKQEIIKLVERYITSARIEEALDTLGSYLEGKDKVLEGSLVAQKHTYEQAKRDSMVGLISRNEYRSILAKLVNNLTMILDELKKEEKGVGGSGGGSSPSGKKKILFLTANPKNPLGPALRLEQEMRAVKDQLLKSGKRDEFELILEPAIGILDIIQAIRNEKPYIIHFSGHGSPKGDGIYVEGDQGEVVKFRNPGLMRLFKKSKEYVNGVLLNACYSVAQAKFISDFGISVIGMSNEMGDDSARMFSEGFYTSIGAGDSIEDAYDMGMVNISGRGHFAHLPELWYNGEKITT
ncbi:MAG: hypothetical protein AAF587_15510 [Bacteroidota bacterium]